MPEIKDSYYYSNDDDRFVMLKQLVERLLQMWLEYPVKVDKYVFQKRYNDFTQIKK